MRGSAEKQYEGREDIRKNGLKLHHNEQRESLKSYGMKRKAWHMNHNSRMKYSPSKANCDI